jgi:hypothetical protein
VKPEFDDGWAPGGALPAQAASSTGNVAMIAALMKGTVEASGESRAGRANVSAPGKRDLARRLIQAAAL